VGPDKVSPPISKNKYFAEVCPPTPLPTHLRFYAVKRILTKTLFSNIRRAMLKKEIIVESKLSSINQIDNMFNEEYFRKTLKIPLAYIKGFEFYIVENERFATVLKSKNKTQIEFGMVSLAEKYNQIIATENK
jgi:hypothetical protein